VVPRVEYVKLGVIGVGLCEQERTGHWSEVSAGFSYDARVAP
jgi:hypothetical protein